VVLRDAGNIVRRCTLQGTLPWCVLSTSTRPRPGWIGPRAQYRSTPTRMGRYPGRILGQL